MLIVFRAVFHGETTQCTLLISLRSNCAMKRPIHAPQPRWLRELAQDPQLAPIVANNPAATADVLRRLTDSGENGPLVATLVGLPVSRADPRTFFDSADETLAAVASNPNTPVEALMRLAACFRSVLRRTWRCRCRCSRNPNLPAEILLYHAAQPAARRQRAARFS